MKLIRNCVVVESEVSSSGAAVAGDGGSAVVLVGVRLDSQSRELLTWALVKVAQSGDRVVALHALNPNTEGKSTLLSLVQTFDSVLAAYEGFCNLKQIDLKLKVCRGSSVRKVLVREAKSYGSAKVIVGISRVRHSIRSSLSIAKYCARKLPGGSFSVTAADNGKILFHREADNDKNTQQLESSLKLLNERPVVLSNGMALVEGLQIDRHIKVDSADSSNEERPLALVPSKNLKPNGSKHGWPMLRRLLLHNQPQSTKSPSLRKSVMQWVVKLPGGQSFRGSGRCKVDKAESSGVDSSRAGSGDGPDVQSGDETTSSPSASYSLESFSKQLNGLIETYSSVCRIFSYEELSLATSNFRPENMIGRGGSSQVFRGCLPDDKELAVKLLKPSEDVVMQFISEIKILTVLRHKNTIALLGFCIEEDKLLLVYDFLSRGSLEDNLHGSRKNEKTFGLEDRYKVALGVAEALNYLHNEAAEPVIHRDVKSSNILLADNFEPQLSDFGLAMRASDSSPHVICIDVAGTFGYLAPEYFMHGKVTERIDVYAFGVVILELLSGRKPIDNANPKGQESLVMWASSVIKDGKHSELVDPTLCGNYDIELSERMAFASALCIRRTPLFRPQINVVLKLLQGDADTVTWAREEVSSASKEAEAVMDSEEFSTIMQNHLSLALLDVEEKEDDSPSTATSDQSVSINDYLEERLSRSSSTR